ncbi:MAG: hypothetical protein KDK91_05640 [Gammaproteobacteria bacterium]|nr:hypothetical protein [Gammaproteobacteria bacterium]
MVIAAHVIALEPQQALDQGIAAYSAGDLDTARSALLEAESAGTTEARVWLARVARDTATGTDDLVQAYAWFTLASLSATPRPKQIDLVLERNEMALPLSLAAIQSAEHQVAERLRSELGTERIGERVAQAVEALYLAAPDTALGAVDIVVELGPAGADAVPALADRFRGNAMWMPLSSFGWALTQIGSAAAPALANLARDELVLELEGAFRPFTAMQALGRMGPAARGIARTLFGAVIDDYPRLDLHGVFGASRREQTWMLRSTAVEVLITIGAQETGLRDDVRQCLQQRIDADIEVLCAGLIGVAFDDMNSAAPVFRKVLAQDKDEQRLAATAVFLGLIGRSAEPFQGALLGLVLNQHESVRNAAAAAIANIEAALRDNGSD